MFNKKMSIKEFREMGLLAEINRTFFHPLGLALEVTVDNGDEKLGGIWDCREDAEGIVYESLPSDKVRKAQVFIAEKHEQRQNMLGFIYQQDSILIESDNTMADNICTIK